MLPLLDWLAECVDLTSATSRPRCSLSLRSRSMSVESSFGHHDIDVGVQVTAHARAQVRHAVPAQRRDRPGLGARGDGELGGSVEDRVDADRGAQRGVDHRHLDGAVQVVAVADEDVVGLLVNLDIQVARGTAAGTDLTLRGQPDPHAVADAGRDLDTDVAARTHAAVAAAAVARVGDDFADAAAGGARPGRHHLAEQRTLHAGDLAAATAGVTRHRL